MSKRISKKILYLFLVATTLLQFDSASPMLGEITHSSDPCQKLSTGTKITDLPLDCLHEIFRYLALKSDYKTEWHDTKPMLKLRFVCKEFRQGVKSFPGPLLLMLNCKNIKNIKHIPLGNVFDNVEELYLNKCDFKSLKIAWPIKLQTLFIWDCKNCNDTSINLRNLRELTVNDCNEFNGNGLAGLTNLCKLSVQSCHNFEGRGLEKLINLHTLVVVHCLNLNWRKLGKLTNLHTLVVGFNQSLDRKELEKLTKLRKLEVSCCWNFDENSDTIKKLRKNGCKVTVE